MTIIEPPKTTCPGCKLKAYSGGYCVECGYCRSRLERIRPWLIGGCVAVFLGLIIWNLK